MSKLTTECAISALDLQVNVQFSNCNRDHFFRKTFLRLSQKIVLFGPGWKCNNWFVLQRDDEQPCSDILTANAECFQQGIKSIGWCFHANLSYMFPVLGYYSSANFLLSHDHFNGERSAIVRKTVNFFYWIVRIVLRPERCVCVCVCVCVCACMRVCVFACAYRKWRSPQVLYNIFVVFNNYKPVGTNQRQNLQIKTELSYPVSPFHSFL